MITSTSILLRNTTENIKHTQKKKTSCLLSSYHIVELPAFLLHMILDIIRMPVADQLHP